MKWIRSVDSDFRGALPSPRSGHTAVRVRKSPVVVFGGLADKKFLQDLIALDTENDVWFKPECTGSGSDGAPGPCARAFHVAVSMDCNMFVFGGRAGRKRFGDFWMLDTDSWQWSELTGFGELPTARDFAAGVSVGNGKLVIYGGWDGTKWLTDVFVLDTISLEWRQLFVSGPSPPPRCGHTATMVEKRMLVFGGRGGGGPILGDLWALKGLFDEEREPPAWTQLKLPGSPPTPRCGHSTTSGGLQLLLFGGHGTAGWLTRYDVYHNDCIVLDRASVQWKRLPISNEAPPARAYHTLTQVGSRFLLLGGYDGKTTFADAWWLVSEDDPLSQRAQSPPQNVLAGLEDASIPAEPKTGEGGRLLSPLNVLRHRLGLPALRTLPVPVADEALDTELIALARNLCPPSTSNIPSLLEAVRNHWMNSDSRSIKLKELGPLLRDYQRLIAFLEEKVLLRASSELDVEGDGQGAQMHRFYHLEDAKQLRLDDIPPLVAEYKQLIQLYLGTNRDVSDPAAPTATPECCSEA